MATATGIHFRTYQAELRLRHTKAEWARLVLVVLLLLAAPYLVNVYWLGIANTILIAVIGAVGLNILVGFTGQISLGQGGFLAVGAYTSAILSTRAGLPVPVAIIVAVLTTAIVGALFGLPALRLKGLYLAIATLASQEIILFVVRRWGFLTEGKGYVEVPRLNLGFLRVERRPSSCSGTGFSCRSPSSRSCWPGTCSAPPWAARSWRCATRTSPPKPSGSTSPGPR